MAAIQLAHRAGATGPGHRVQRRHVSTASREFGLDHGIDYSSAEFADEVRRLTDGRGADVILDSVGRRRPPAEPLLPGLPRPVHHLRRRRPGGSPTRLDITTMRAHNQTLVGYFLGAELFLGNRAHAVIARHLDDIAAGSLRVVIDRRFPLEQAGEAHAYIESRQAFGRVLLIP